MGSFVMTALVVVMMCSCTVKICANERSAACTVMRERFCYGTGAKRNATRYGCTPPGGPVSKAHVTVRLRTIPERAVPRM